LKEKQNRKGPVVTYAPAGKRPQEVILSLQKEENTAFQRLASSRLLVQTRMHLLTVTVVASALISLPLRYTTMEMVHRDDVENVIKLIYETLLKLENNENFFFQIIIKFKICSCNKG
jgi:putative aminopeptidase FrvX